MNRGHGRDRAFWVAAALLVIVYALLPVVWIISLSLKKTGDLTDGSFLPSSVTFDNYRSIFDQGQFTDALRNSIGIALIATLVSVLLATSAAYAIARLDFPGKRLVLGAALAIAMFPAISVVSPLFDIWRRIGLYDTWLGLIIPYMTFTLPLAIWTLSAFFREIPWELEQAAQADGATPFQAFRYVIAPLATPGMFTAAILTFIFAWNDFLFAISLTSSDRARTAPAAIAFFNGNSQFQQPTGSIAAAAVVITVPIIVMVLLFQRRIVSGLTSGAVKG
jgi:trehalose/maltose transport system permease protein